MCDARESIKCPPCGEEHAQTRFDGIITCKSCNAEFIFSRRSQKLLLMVIILIPVVGVVSGVTLHIFGQFAGTLTVLLGTVAVFALLIYQGIVPQSELVKSNKPLQSDAAKPLD